MFIYNRVCGKIYLRHRHPTTPKRNSWFEKFVCLSIIKFSVWLWRHEYSNISDLSGELNPAPNPSEKRQVLRTEPPLANIVRHLPSRKKSCDGCAMRVDLYGAVQHHQQVHIICIVCVCSNKHTHVKVWNVAPGSHYHCYTIRRWFSAANILCDSGWRRRPWHSHWPVKGWWNISVRTTPFQGEHDFGIFSLFEIPDSPALWSRRRSILWMRKKITHLKTYASICSFRVKLMISQRTVFSSASHIGLERLKKKE